MAMSIGSAVILGKSAIRPASIIGIFFLKDYPINVLIDQFFLQSKFESARLDLLFKIDNDYGVLIVVIFFKLGIAKILWLIPNFIKKRLFSDFFYSINAALIRS